MAKIIAGTANKIGRMLLISGFLKAVGREASAKLTARNRIDGNSLFYFAVEIQTVPCFLPFWQKPPGVAVQDKKCVMYIVYCILYFVF